MSNRTVGKIKTLARSLFAVKGYDATTMNDIAEGVGIKKPAIYTYFDGKDALFLAVFRELLEAYKRDIEAILAEAASKPVRDRLYVLFEQYILCFSRDPESSMLWNRIFLFPPLHLKDQLFAEIGETERPFSAALQAALAEGVREGAIRGGNLEELELSFRSLREGLLLAYLINPGLDKTKIRGVWNAYWRGIGMESGGSSCEQGEWLSRGGM
jgi:AcrR family transcriptional regulator